MIRSAAEIANEAKSLGKKIQNGEYIEHNALQILAAYIEELAQRVAELERRESNRD